MFVLEMAIVLPQILVVVHLVCLEAIVLRHISAMVFKVVHLMFAVEKDNVLMTILVSVKVVILEMHVKHLIVLKAF